MSAIPKTMRALVLTAIPSQLEVREVPVPTPGDGQVLVKIACSPVNPSDTAFLRGNYGLKRELPTIPGFEGRPHARARPPARPQLRQLASPHDPPDVTATTVPQGPAPSWPTAAASWAGW